MKVQVTVAGILKLDAGDVTILERASAGEVLDTMRYQATGLRAIVQRPPKREKKDKAEEGQQEASEEA